MDEILNPTMSWTQVIYVVICLKFIFIETLIRQMLPDYDNEFKDQVKQCPSPNFTETIPKMWCAFDELIHNLTLKK